MKKTVCIIICFMLFATTALAEIIPEIDESANFTVKGINEGVYNGDFAVVKVVDALSTKTIFLDDNIASKSGKYEFESFNLGDVYGIKIYQITTLVGGVAESLEYVYIRGGSEEQTKKIFDDATALSPENFTKVEKRFFEYFGAGQKLEALNAENGKLKNKILEKLPEIESGEELLLEIDNLIIMDAVTGRLWNITKDMLEKYIGLNSMFRNYSSLDDSEKQELYRYISDAGITSVEEFKSEMNYKINNILTVEKPPVVTPPAIGGGGGGGGGGSSDDESTIAVSGNPVVPAPEITEQELIVEDFGDVPKEHWSYEAIMAMKEIGVISGGDDGNFRPDDNVTRAEFVRMIVSLLGIESKKDVDFFDVNENAWYYKHVCAAYEKGIIAGDGVSFMPNKNISREEMAVIIARILNQYVEIEGNTEKEYSDFADVSGWATESVNLLSQAEIMSGYPGNKFMPKEYATRAQAAKVLCSLYETVKNN